jgi:hypothetical protein
MFVHSDQSQKQIHFVVSSAVFFFSLQIRNFILLMDVDHFCILVGLSIMLIEIGFTLQFPVLLLLSAIQHRVTIHEHSLEVRAYLRVAMNLLKG